MGVHPLTPLFTPRSIAVFGASMRSRSVGAMTYANLLQGGFKGEIYPVNPKYDALDGRPCFDGAAALPEGVDLAVIATPARTVPGILRDLGEAGIRQAIVLSAGFAEGASAEGATGKALENELGVIAKQYGIRFLGPNCVGMTRPWIGLNASFLRSATPVGRLALVSQSGALLSAIADWAGPHHSGFSALVSLGNSANVDFGDVVEFLATDPKTDAILLYMEGVRDAPAFLSALRHAARLKPVIVMKAGRHAVSAEAAHTHTGALIGSDAVFEAAIERAGAVRADTLGQLFAAAELLATTKKAGGKRLCIVTNGGGAGVLAADRAADLGLELPDLSEKSKAALDAALPAYWSHANPVDILGDASPEDYAHAVKVALDDPGNDGVLILLTPQAMTDATAVAQAVVDAMPKRRRKPVLTCWMGESSILDARHLLSENGVPDFITPERAVEGFSYLAKYHRNRKLALEMPRALPPEAQPDYDGARMIIEGALSDGRSMLSATEAKALLRAFHIPVNMTVEAADPRAALVAAETVGFPVAMKINAPEVSHKTDVGGVRINIAHATSVKRAFYEIMANFRRAQPDGAAHGVTIEPMSRLAQARELVIGASRDPVFGPTVLFGAGGTMVEVMRDSAVALPPLNSVLANRLINRTRVAKALDQFRDYAPADRTAVVEVLKRVSKVVCELPEVISLDINPLMAGPEGVLAVDARIEIARPPADHGMYDHMAIHPYPRHLIRSTYLNDGTPLTIRPIRTDDAEHVQDFTRNLSEEARLMRFMGQVNELSPEMLMQFTQLDYRREMALVAMAELEGKQVLVGVARYVINPDEKSCEFAIVVSDRIQHQGLGTRLMKGLFEAAKQHGLDVIEGTVLKKNAPMLRLMKELGFRQRPDPDDRDLVIVERWL